MLYIARKEKGDTQRKVASEIRNKSTTLSVERKWQAHFTLPEAKIFEMYGMSIDDLFSKNIKVGS